MNSQLVTLQKMILAETVPAHPDFEFEFAVNSKGNLTIDHRGTWEFQPTPDDCSAPYLTIEHDGESFLISHWGWGEQKKYKTLKGAAKYIHAEIAESCENRRKRKAKDDTEKTFEEKSLALLRDFHGKLTESGVIAKFCPATPHYQTNHIHVEAVLLKTSLEITVTHDYQLEIALANQRCSSAPDAAIDLIFALVKKATA